MSIGHASTFAQFPYSRFADARNDDHEHGGPWGCDVEDSKYCSFLVHQQLANYANDLVAFGGYLGSRLLVDTPWSKPQASLAYEWSLSACYTDFNVNKSIAVFIGLDLTRQEVSLCRDGITSIQRQGRLKLDEGSSFLLALAAPWVGPITADGTNVTAYVFTSSLLLTPIATSPTNNPPSTIPPFSSASNALSTTLSLVPPFGLSSSTIAGGSTPSLATYPADGHNRAAIVGGSIASGIIGLFIVVSLVFLLWKCYQKRRSRQLGPRPVPFVHIPSTENIALTSILQNSSNHAFPTAAEFATHHVTPPVAFANAPASPWISGAHIQFPADANAGGATGAPYYGARESRDTMQSSGRVWFSQHPQL
ncbi:hypothetical protein PIIN_08576 [Serendipita indica DSM 11827]|uniref:Uncharacterized protein n=1 Tax=Serendipita indica (strain DSM 11827) TaxID=1109443 RepID=G4TTI0_SERID|nr:hypothetical protein PIIN_08576 [Serendipita indica DSM 11827]